METTIMVLFGNQSKRGLTSKISAAIWEEDGEKLYTQHRILYVEYSVYKILQNL